MQNLVYVIVWTVKTIEKTLTNSKKQACHQPQVASMKSRRFDGDCYAMEPSTRTWNQQRGRAQEWSEKPRPSMNIRASSSCKPQLNRDVQESWSRTINDFNLTLQTAWSVKVYPHTSQQHRLAASIWALNWSPPFFLCRYLKAPYVWYKWFTCTPRTR